MARIEPISRDIAKQHLRVLHNDEDLIIDEYIETARNRCEELTGLTLSYEEGEDAVEVPATIKQAMRILIAAQFMDREGSTHMIKAETTIQNLLFNARLTMSEIAERDA